MNNKQYTRTNNSKAQRTREHFINTTKQMILKEGISNVSIRKIADCAGYSYATIYNHFLDLEGLLQAVKIVMMKDALEYMQMSLPKGLSNVSDVKKLVILHVNYYLDNPYIYHFFYTYSVAPQKSRLAILVDMDSLWMNNFKELSDYKIIAKDDSDVIAKTLIYATHGVLTLYFSDNELSVDKMYHDLDQIVDKLCKK